MSKKHYVYILSNKTNSTVYIGTTRNLEYRIAQHKNHVNPGFTDLYNVTKLVYYEEFDMANEAIAREKQLKGWRREKKDNLINSMNPERKDLAADWNVHIWVDDRGKK